MAASSARGRVGALNGDVTARRAPGWHTGPPPPISVRSVALHGHAATSISPALPTAQSIAREAISDIKACLGDSFREFQELSLRFRRGEIEAARYYDQAVAMIELGRAGSVTSVTADAADTLFCRLAMTLPDGMQKTKLLDARSSSRCPAPSAIPAKPSTATAHEAAAELPECPLCFSKEQDTLLSTHCGHPICVTCLQAWQVADAEASNLCAVCRRPLILITAAPATKHTSVSPKAAAAPQRKPRRGRRKASEARAARVSRDVSLDEALRITGLAHDAVEGVGRIVVSEEKTVVRTFGTQRSGQVSSSVWKRRPAV